ncbi:hypothetical protein bthur0012_53240 [Bacillus thuringiensis serovar pulsiensis BGSC 4CC1]|nr:hypothetical protein bthur0012_53240 [Bacillus thuringiensis serovar pulsiensis BGSC 4CC1]
MKKAMKLQCIGICISNESTPKCGYISSLLLYSGHANN